MTHARVMQEARLRPELLATRGTRVVPDCSVSHLMFPHVLRIHEPRVTLTTSVRPLVPVLGVCVTIKKPLASELHSTVPALVPPLPQVDVTHVGVQVLLLVEPHPAHLALKGFVP